MTLISVRQATEAEQQGSESWEVWESGDMQVFEYSYDQDVCFIGQAGEAVIHSQSDAPVAIAPGCHVTIRQGMEGRWEISAPIVNRYQYL